MKSRAQNDRRSVDKKQEKEFNELLKEFINNFYEITKIDCVTKCIDATLNFLTMYNGSKFLFDWRNKYITENVDILDFWNETLGWEKLKFSTNYERYVWLFLKYDVKFSTINIKQLEKFFGLVNKKNKEAKANDIVKMLTKVLENFAEVTENSSDSNKTINFSYNIKVGNWQ